VKEQYPDRYNCEISGYLNFFLFLHNQQTRHILLDEEDPAPRCVIDNYSSENGPEETGNGKDGAQNASVEANLVDSDDFGDDDEYGRVDTRAADTLQCAKDDPIWDKEKKKVR
jgi:hypothetical protein